MTLRSLLPILAIALLPHLASASDGVLRTASLRCESLTDPIGIDEASPRLSWIVESDRRGARQTAYRILVASSVERLSADDGDLWDSGRVETDDSIGVVYTGPALRSRQECYWKVMAWDGGGERGPWSEPARWEMGLLAPEDWRAGWVDAGPSRTTVVIDSAVYSTEDGAVRVDVTEAVRRAVEAGEPIVAGNALGGDPAYNARKRLAVEYRVEGVPMRAEAAEGATAALHNTRTPYLRRSFSVDKPVRRARLYATALGVYEPYLNGERVGDAWLAPGWTDYRERVYYQTFDITGKIRRGRNVLGAIVGPGWFAGRAGLFHARAFYGQTPALRAQLEITYEDGSTQWVVTDDSWRRHDGPIVVSDIMDGEVYDARQAIDGWCTDAVDDGAWSPVSTRVENRRLQAAPDLPVRVLDELPALALSQPQPRRWVFDLGQNMVGVARIRVREAPGTVITIRHAEMLNPDGTLYTENLRGAAATDTFVCRAGGLETWTPRFTFHGFRYVELSGLTAPPDAGAVTGVVLGSDLPPTGSFVCSDDRLNRLYSNIVWGLRGNYVSIPTDCPQRDERMGWMGDAQAFIPTATRVADVGPFMTKWMRDVRDAQREDGAYPDVAPVMKGLSYATPAWADAGVIVPWEIYQAYADTRILEQNLDPMTRWVEWCREHSTDLIRDRDRGNDYGDWLSIDADTPKELLGTAYFARSTDLLARAYAALGRDADAAEYRALFEQIRGAFAARYVGDDGRIAGDTQTAYLLALAFDLVPPGVRDAAMGHLLDNLRDRGWRLNTGFVGVGYLLPTLDDAGHTDAAYRLLLQDEFPSWLFSVGHGATTIWERWDGWTPDRGMNDPGMNSFNHYALGSCGEWLFAGVGGIRAEEPGFRTITIRPRIGAGLRWAETSLRSVRGTIATRWELAPDRLTLSVEIPANTTATVIVPTADPASVRESGAAIDRAEGVRVLRAVPGALTLEIGSGRYAFTAAPAPLPDDQTAPKAD
jgi:alpha-L-rhamnosidase